MAKVFLFFIFSTLLGTSVWADSSAPDATSIEPVAAVDAVPVENQCTNDHDWETLFSDKAAIALHCGPAMASVGLTMGSAIASKLAGTQAGKYVATQASKVAAGKAIGKFATRMVLGMNLVGGAVLAFEVLNVLAGIGGSARDCQLYEHELKASVYDEVDQKGQRIIDAFAAQGIELTEVQKNRLFVQKPYRDRVTVHDCGRVNLHAEYMNQRQNDVYTEVSYANNVYPVIPDPPERQLSDEDKSIIAGLYSDLKCMEPAQAVRTVCAIGNLIVIGRQLPREIRDWRRTRDERLRASRVPTPDQRRRTLFATAVRNDMRFPQSTFGNVGGQLNGLFNGKFRMADVVKPATTEEISNVTQIGIRAHKARGLNPDLVTTESVTRLLRGYRVTTENTYESWLENLYDASRGKLRNGYLLERGPNGAVGLDEFVASQDPVGRAYLARFGQNFDAAFNSEKMNRLSSEWRSFLESKEYLDYKAYSRSIAGRSVDRSTEPARFVRTRARVNEYYDRMIRNLEEDLSRRHPELNRPIVPGESETFLQDMLRSIRGMSVG